jgi:hypothetical protein
VQLLREVVGFADLADHVELRLQPVGVLLFALEDFLEEVAAAVVAFFDAQRDPPVQAVDGL